MESLLTTRMPTSLLLAAAARLLPEMKPFLEGDAFLDKVVNAAEDNRSRLDSGMEGVTERDLDQEKLVRSIRDFANIWAKSFSSTPEQQEAGKRVGVILEKHGRAVDVEALIRDLGEESAADIVLLNLKSIFDKLVAAQQGIEDSRQLKRRLNLLIEAFAELEVAGPTPELLQGIGKLNQIITEINDGVTNPRTEEDHSLVEAVEISAA